MSGPGELGAAALAFLAERRIATLTLVTPGGRPHVTPVGVTWDDQTGLARVITWSGSAKARLLDRHGPLRAATSEHDGARWITLEGTASVTGDPGRCAEAVARYAARYRPPGDRGDERRAIEIRVDRVLTSRSLRPGHGGGPRP